MMIALLVVVSSTQANFDADDLLLAAGYRSNIKRESPLGERAGHWEDQQGNRFFTRHDVLSISDFMVGRSAENPSEAREEFMRNSMPEYDPNGAESFVSYSGNPLGIGAALPYLGGGTKPVGLLYAFGQVSVTQVRVNGKPVLGESNWEVPGPEKEDLLLAEAWCRWRLSHLESPGETDDRSRSGHQFDMLIDGERVYIPLRTYADVSRWSREQADHGTRITLGTPKGELKVYVGSDAIEWNGELIRTGHIHPAKGDEIYLPVSFLDEYGL